MQYLTDFHHLHHVSIRLATPRSFYTTKQYTTTIFVSCFRAGKQTLFLFGPHAHFLSQSAVQQPVAFPASTSLLSASLEPRTEKSHLALQEKQAHVFVPGALVQSLCPSPDSFSLPRAPCSVHPPKTLSTCCATSLGTLQLKWKPAHTEKS